MARLVKPLQPEPSMVAELRWRAWSTTIGLLDRERINIILMRLEELSVDAVAERLKTTAKRVSIWSRRFARRGLDELVDARGRAA